MRSTKQAAAKLGASAAAASLPGLSLAYPSGFPLASGSLRARVPTLRCVIGDAGVRAAPTALGRGSSSRRDASLKAAQAHGEGVSANEVANYLAREIRGDCPDEPLRYDAATPSACRPPARKP